MSKRDSTLTQERLKELLHYDPETGVFTRRTSRGGELAGAIAGCPVWTGYTKICVDKTNYLAHRLAWFYVYGDFPSEEIDHINGVRTDNFIKNLRHVSSRVNKENKRFAQSNSKSGALGASPFRGGFRARIFVNGREKHLGTFNTAEAAHAAYLVAKRALHEGCTI